MSVYRRAMMVRLHFMLMTSICSFYVESLHSVTPSYPSHYHYEFPMKTTDDGKVLGLSDPALKQLIHANGAHSKALATTGQQGDDNYIKGVTAMYLHSPAFYLLNNIRDEV